MRQSPTLTDTPSRSPLLTFTLEPMMTAPADPRATLATLARRFYERGWMAGAAGNLSCRLPDGSIEITALMRPKDNLREDDFLQIAIDGQILRKGRAQDKPSTAAAVHLALYDRFPGARYVAQLLPAEAQLVARMALSDELPLPALEHLKAFGIWEVGPEITIPVFENHPDAPRIAGEIRARVAASPPRVPGLLIREHGLTLWASSAQQLVNYAEVFDHLFRFMLQARMAGLD